MSTAYPLKYPVELKKADGTVTETITELTLNRLKGKDARHVLNEQGKGNGHFMVALVCASAQIPPSTFDQLDAEDALGAFEAADGFFGSAQATSSK